MATLCKRSKSEAGIALLTTILLMLLMSSMLVGFIILINTGQKVSGMNNDYSKAFYAAEAGMEKITADLGNLFDTNYSPSGAQVDVIATQPPVLSGVNYIRYDGRSAYAIDYPKDGQGNPVATITQIKSGPYQGMTALATPYTLNVTARTNAGSEVKLQRTTQTVGIPMFQFGVFSDTDLSFFPGPVFNFGGRTHTNGNLFLASGNALTLSDRVTAVKDVIRTNLSNGFPTTTGQYGGAVNIFNGAGTRPLAFTEGSLVGTVGSAVNPSWKTISLGTYAANLRGASTGPGTPLNLGIVTLGSGSTQAIDVIRRPKVGEAVGVTAERYFAQASIKILLSDNPIDITSLPCIDNSKPPVDLSLLSMPLATWAAATDFRKALLTQMTANNTAGFSTPPVPLAASGAKAGLTAYNNQTGATGDQSGYWSPALTPGGVPTPSIKGFLKIEIQTNYNGTPCGTWKDVTLEVLGYGYAGRNINPYTTAAGYDLKNNNTNTTYLTAAGAAITRRPAYDTTGANPPLLALQNAQIGASTCKDVHPNAIIRLERVRDNPSNWSSASADAMCGVTLTAGKVTGYPTFASDYWPNVLFDTREGTLRDTAPPNGTVGAPPMKYANMVPLNGVMTYIELDTTNLIRYLTGALPGSGNQAYDPNVAPNDYSVYFSDRRGNYVAVPPASPWPPVSFSGHETGEYGFQDFVNPADLNGCPNSRLDSGEDLDGLGAGIFFTYGQDATLASLDYRATSPLFPTNLGGNGYYGSALGGGVAAVKAVLVGNNTTTNPLTGNPVCPAVNSPTSIWPFDMVVYPNEARENPNFFFRRALKLVDGANMAGVMNNCPGGVICGLTVAAEGPVYIQGDYNCVACTANTFSAAHIAASVLGDSVTLLSNNWNDVNSFIAPYNLNLRNGVTTYYRTALMAGKGVSFPQPAGTAQDFGTDGGVHNFLRYIENWGGQTLNYRGSLISMYYNRQGTGTFKCCTTVYSPPTRGYNFDVEFLQPNLLPPRTPLFRDVNTTGFTQLLLPTQ